MMNKEGRCDCGGCTKLGPCCLGVAFGITKALCLIILAWVGWLSGYYGISIVEELASIYYGYSATFLGGLIGGIWGLVIGFILGVIFAWVYNHCFCRCCKKSCSIIEKNKGV